MVLPSAPRLFAGVGELAYLRQAGLRIMQDYERRASVRLRFRRQAKSMLLYSAPILSEEILHGLKGTRVTFTLQGTSGRMPNPKGVAIVDEVFGAEWTEPELGGAPLPPEGSPVRQLLGWVYRAFKQAQWPVFQPGVFEAEGDEAFDGTYHLPTRIGPSMLPFRLFRLLFENTWLETTGSWSERAFIDALNLMIEQMRGGGLPGTNQRWVLLELLRRDQALTEIGSDIFQIGSGAGARFIRGTLTDDVSHLLLQIQHDKVAAGQLMRLHGIPTMEQRRVRDRQQVFAAATQLGYPVVLKPFNGTQSRRVFSELSDRQALDQAMAAYGSDLSDALVERFVPGISLRIFVMNGRILWIVGRLHQFVTGDGERSVDELIRDYCDQEINDGFLEKYRTDPNDFYDRFRIHKKFTHKKLKSILPAGERLRLSDLPSASYGALQANYSAQNLSTSVLENVLYLSRLFGDAPLGIDAIGTLVDDQFDHLVFNEVNFAPQITRPWSRQLFIDALLETRP